MEQGLGSAVQRQEEDVATAAARAPQRAWAADLALDRVKMRTRMSSGWQLGIAQAR